VKAGLLDLLACPVTRTKLRWDEKAGELISDAAGLAYPVRDGVPVLLVEEARVLDPPRHGEGDQPQAGGGAGTA
jgi:uncharacterized protein YbaR (Trm112 family)